MMKLNESHIKMLFFAALLAVLGGIRLALPDFYVTVWDLSTSGNMEGTIAYLRSFGIWAMAISMIIDIVINMVGFLPSIFISTANGVVFGIWTGTVVSWLAETIGVVISFFFMRTLFRHKAQKVIEHSKMLTKLDEYSTLKAMIIARAVPYSPNGLVTALGALSHISYRDYIIACLIGKLPSVAVEVVVGHDVVMMEDNSMRLTILVIVVAIVYGGLWYWNRRRKAIKVLEKIKEDLSDEKGRSKERPYFCICNYSSSVSGRASWSGVEQNVNSGFRSTIQFVCHSLAMSKTNRCLWSLTIIALSIFFSSFVSWPLF